LYRDLEGGINLVAFFRPHFPLPAMMRRDRARRAIAAMMSDVIAQRRAAARASDDVLDALISAGNPDGTPLTDHLITGLLLTLLSAGQHRSGVMGAWTGILLLGDPDHLDAVLAEQNAVLHDSRFTLARLKELTCLERCLKEAERLHPPLVVLMRKTLAPFEVLGHTIPAGDLVLVSPAISH